MDMVRPPEDSFVPVPKPLGPRPVLFNLGIVLRGSSRALDEMLEAIEEKREILGIQMPFIKRTGSWLTIVEGKPSEVLEKGTPRDAPPKTI